MALTDNPCSLEGHRNPESLEMKIIDQVTIIVGYSQLLLRRGVVGREFLHQSLSQISQAAERIAGLVEQIEARRNEPGT